MSKVVNPLSRRHVLGLGGLGLLALTAERAAALLPGARLTRRSGIAFGAVVSVTLVDDGSGAVEPAFRDAFAAMRAIERAASLFDANSELSRLNRYGVIDNPSDDLIALVDFGLRLARHSEGAFDPTVQPVWQTWQRAQRRGGRPDGAELTAAVALVGYQHVRREERRIGFARPGMSMTFNGLAQGLASDRVIAAVARHGIQHALVDAGELGARGVRPDARAWRVAIAHPRDEQHPAAEIDLASRRFVSTSADNHTAWTEDFAEHHIVEPWSGHSPAELAEVAVVASSGLLADGLSTAAMVAGRARLGDLLAIDPGASALVIGKNGGQSVIGTEFGGGRA